MRPVDHRTEHRQLNECLATRGFRFTLQRHQVYEILRQTVDHPTAEAVFIRAKQAMPEISLATVYNCLDALVQCGLAKLVNLQRGATRYCANMKEHWHFHCEACESVFDVALAEGMISAGAVLPNGFKAKRFEMAIYGLCPACREEQKG
jgi:Fe2+ or Zn2+ uptake regulation protein